MLKIRELNAGEARKEHAHYERLCIQCKHVRARVYAGVGVK